MNNNSLIFELFESQEINRELNQKSECHRGEGG